MATHAESVEILRKRELELISIRRNFYELSCKFSQLEKAFAMNLLVHKALEREVESLKSENNENETEKKLSSLLSSLTVARTEKTRWQQAFLHEKKVSERQRCNHEKSLRKMRDECEMMVKNYRKDGEERLCELLKLCEDSRRKLSVAEEHSRACRAREKLTRDRILEFTNLLETLEKFKGVGINVLREYSTRVLRSLMDADEKTYEEAMENLRRVTRDSRENDESESLACVREQNFVLRQIVKNLKRKLQGNHVVSDGKEEFKDEFLSPRGNSDGEKISREKPEVAGKTIPESTNEDANVDCSGRIETSDEKMSDKFIEENSIFPHAKSVDVETFESHRDGVRYEETKFKFSCGREMRVRQPRDETEVKKSSVKIVEFVNSEKKFHDAPINRIVFYLGDDARETVNFDKSVMHCAVQTRRIKLSEKFCQTAMTGSSGFFRINAGIGVLNSERRAIERSIGKLEHTVASLKEKALDQARSMIGCDVDNLGNAFFDCVRRLES